MNASEWMIPETEVLALSQINEGVYINRQHLLVGPQITVKLLKPETDTQPKIVPRLSVQHTNGGKNSADPWSLWIWASKLENVVEPHLDFGLNGDVLQYLPFDVRSDCTYKANRFQLGSSDTWWGAIAHETQDYGYKVSPSEVNAQPWTLQQLLSLVRAITAECATYRIRCTIPTHKFDSGVGWHAQYPEWSTSGHSCPGNARIRQMPYLWNAVAERLAKFYQAVGRSCP